VEGQDRLARPAHPGVAPSLPGALDDFTALVLPELRQRGLYRSEYEHRDAARASGLGTPPGPGAAQEKTR